MKRIMKIRWFWIVAGMLMWVGGYGQCHIDDYEALRALYFSAGGGPNWGINWNQVIGNTPPIDCDLETLLGVTLNQNGRVESLSLGDNLLNGNIPPEIGSLSHLEHLGLSSDSLTGNIPPELGNLTNLRWLYLVNSQLTGSIPSELGNLTNLWELHLEFNQLSGSIPPELGNLNNLEELWLANNQLSGDIPSQFGNLSKLRWLMLSTNQLSGSIPPELGNLDDLAIFWVFSNQLSGCHDINLLNLCDIGGGAIIGGNNFDTSWECFCTYENCNISWISASLSAIDPSCNNNDGSIQLTIESGIAPFEYSWNNGDSVEDPFNLSEGTYIVTVSDAETCNGIAVDTITLSIPASPIIDTIVVNDALCGNNNGALTITTSGGTPPYEYSVNGSDFQSENNFTLAADTYGLVVRDAANCVANESVTIGDDTPVINLGADAFTCELPNRILDAGYPAQWSTGETGQTITVSDYGTYSVTVTDADCEVTDEIILEDVIQFYASTVDTMIAAGEYVDISLSGADSYLWTPTDGLDCSTCDNVRIQPESSTTYTVTASTNDGCEKNFSIRVGIGGPSVFPPGGVLVFPELADPDAFPMNQFSVYNRWGTQVFHAQPYDNTWDGTYQGNGTPLPPGNYYYILELDVANNNIIKQRLFIGR